MLRQSRRALGGAALAILFTATPLSSAFAQENSAAAAQDTELRPGQYRWWPEASASGPVEIVVSIPLQVAYVYRGGTLIGVSTVSTGREGYETPAGSFPILQKERVHHSNRYENAPMPFMQRLTWDGVALHAGQIPGHPASHGCIRLPLAFARQLFSVTRLGANVHVVEDSVSPEQATAYLRTGGTQVASSTD